jgi:PTS system nitrogen regulatory IIA component
VQLHSLTRPGLIFPNLPGRDTGTLLRAFSECLSDEGLVDSAEDLYEKLSEREDLGSTGIGFGVAIPHCKLTGLESVVLAVATSEEGVDYGAIDGAPVRLFFMVLSPVKDPAAHLQSLAAISKWVKADEHVERILRQANAESIHELLWEDSNSL